jgi:carbamoyltransferase
MYILGISAYYHDSAACLLKDGVILAAAQEERFTRIKNDAAFPENSINYCLQYAGITLAQVDHIAYYEKPFLKFERLLETHLAFAPFGIRSFLKAMPLWLKEKLAFKKMLIKALTVIDPDWKYTNTNLLFTTHHQSHAASAFYPSPFKEALILTIDGVGEWETASISRGEGNAITQISHINFPHSLGLLYSAFTYYLGFKVNCDEYKVMGLAPYGKPIYIDLISDNLIDVKPDGSFRLDMRYFEYATGLTMTGKRFATLFQHPVRQPGSNLFAFHMDMAASIQQVTEQVMLKITANLHQQYKIDNLCLAGGVALNCVANGKILKQSGFKNIWIQPAAGDAGGALGAALAVHYEYLKQQRNADNVTDQMQNALLGPAYTSAQIKKELEKSGLTYEEFPDEKLYPLIAREIAAGKVIGYFKGRMEFGPRALGARSIIADARNPDMQSVLNLKIKFRESFRPFAPAVLEERADEYFDLDAPSPYMLLTADVKQEKRVALSNENAEGFDKFKQILSVIPAVTHVDYSARLQTVNPRQHPDFYNLIKAFYNLTGCPMVINTSFNRMDEPIVCTPADAIACFLNTGIDVLVMEGFVVRK